MKWRKYRLDGREFQVAVIRRRPRGGAHRRQPGGRRGGERQEG